jgi:hypothetical protein
VHVLDVFGAVNEVFEQVVDVPVVELVIELLI